MFPMFIRRFVIMAVAVPLAAASARKLSNVVEARRGPNKMSGFLRQGADLLQGLRPQKRRRFHR